MPPKKEKETFDVERIVNQRKGKGGKMQYEIKWVGYAETSWEPESSLTECSEALNEFKRTHKDTNGTPSQSTPRTPHTRTTRASGATTSAVRGSSPSVNGPPSTVGQSITRRSTMRADESDAVVTVSQASSSSSQRSTRSNGGGSTNEKMPLEEKLKALIEASNKKGNRKRGAAPDDCAIPVKILKKDELEELEIWTAEKYKESQKNDRKRDEDTMEKFFDKKIIGIIGHYPGDKQSFYVINTEGKKSEKITENVYGVECVLATRLFPKIVVNYQNTLATSLVDINNATGNGKPSTSK